MDLIYSPSSHFTSVRDPFSEDSFVRTTYAPAQEDGSVADRFLEHLGRAGLLPALVSAIASENPAGGEAPLRIVDCGVYMGVFSIGAALCARKQQIPFRVAAYEANPKLVAGIKRNMALYGIDGAVHWNGVGGSRGMIEFTYPVGSMVGGTLFNTAAKKKLGGEYVSLTCEVVPLADVLADRAGVGLVKLDIEGNEVKAFGSIETDPALLDNVFIVEFAPYQARAALPSGALYGEWLCRTFSIFNARNWLYGPLAGEITDPAGLAHVLDENNKPFNVDLVLVPRHRDRIVSRLRDMLAGRGGGG